MAFNDTVRSNIGNRILQMVKSGYQMSGLLIKTRGGWPSGQECFGIFYCS